MKRNGDKYGRFDKGVLHFGVLKHDGVREKALLLKRDVNGRDVIFLQCLFDSTVNRSQNQNFPKAPTIILFTKRTTLMFIFLLLPKTYFCVLCSPFCNVGGPALKTGLFLVHFKNLESEISDRFILRVPMSYRSRMVDGFGVKK